MHSNWFNALKTLSVISFILLLNTRWLALAEEIPNEDEVGSVQIEDPEEHMSKRAWQQLQGSWGKRSLIDDIKNENLQRIAQHDDYQEGLRNIDYEPMRFRDYKLIPDADDFDESSPANKRAWKSMSNAWGKRAWSKGNTRDSGWGKREPGNWNNLRGLWGKRASPQSWNRLSPAWGK